MLMTIRHVGQEDQNCDPHNEDEKACSTGNTHPLQTVAPRCGYTSELLELLSDFLSCCRPSHSNSFQARLIFTASWTTFKPLHLKGPSHLPLSNLSIPTHPSRLCPNPMFCRRTSQIPQSDLRIIIACMVKNGFREDLSYGLGS